MLRGFILPISQMFSKYERNYPRFLEQNIKIIIEESKISSISATSGKYGIPLSMLHRHIQKSSHKKQRGKFRRTFGQQMERELAVVVCTGLALGPGLGLVAQMMFGSRPSSGLVQMIAIKSYIQHFGLSRVIIFSQRKSYS
jgi:hypothetical protein